MRRTGQVMLFCMVAFFVTPLQAGDFFEIKKIKIEDKEPKDQIGVWREMITKDPETHKNLKEYQFIPSVSVEVMVEKQTQAKGLIAKLYVLDKTGKTMTIVAQPSAVGRPGYANYYKMPVLFPAKDRVKLFFALPEKIRESADDYGYLVVFGDKQAVAADVYPSRIGSPTSLDFAEKETYLNRTLNSLDRKEAMDPVVELVVKTKNPRVPQLTLFLRPPVGMTDGSQAKGVLACCTLAGHVEDIRRRMQGLEQEEEMSDMMKFAEKHQLAILAWGSRSIWNPGKNYDEYDKESFEDLEESFDEVADAWEKGVEKLHEKYGIPDRNFMLTGSSGAAQWAHRLALRKPDYFLAVSIHIPSSFDKPTPEANKILWCLTTGELESGYERSKRFYADCVALDYPIVYKAIMGLGHQGHPVATELRFKFFEFAMGLKDERAEYDAIMSDSFRKAEYKVQGPWPKEFREAPYVGDIVNQEMYPAEKEAMVPKGFRVYFPNKELAETWNN